MREILYFHGVIQSFFSSDLTAIWTIWTASQNFIIFSFKNEQTILSVTNPWCSMFLAAEYQIHNKRLYINNRPSISHKRNTNISDIQLFLSTHLTYLTPCTILLSKISTPLNSNFSDRIMTSSIQSWCHDGVFRRRLTKRNN